MGVALWLLRDQVGVASWNGYHNSIDIIFVKIMPRNIQMYISFIVYADQYSANLKSLLLLAQISKVLDNILPIASFPGSPLE